MTDETPYPCFWLSPSPAPRAVALRMNTYFPNAQSVAEGHRDALAQALMSCDAEWVFVIGPNLLPYSSLPKVRPEGARNARPRPMRFLSRNSVTGEFNSKHGPELWPRELLLSDISGTDAAPGISLVPRAMSQWYVNSSGRAAYSNAHTSITERMATASDAKARQALEISASLGADAPNGFAWIAGACAALLGLSAEAEAWIENTDAVHLAAKDYARRVRLETKFDVHVLGPGECRLMRDLCFQMPPSSIYDEAATCAEDGTTDGARQARILRAAGDWLWQGQHPPD